MGDCVVDGGVGPCEPPIPRIALVLVLVVVFAAFIWWLAALRWSQTPGKMLLGIQATRNNGKTPGWRFSFVREAAIKGFPFIFGLVLILTTWAVSFSFFFMVMAVLVDNLWALRDQNGQAVHDKVMGTLVVQKRTPD